MADKLSVRHIVTNISVHLPRRTASIVAFNPLPV